MNRARFRLAFAILAGLAAVIWVSDLVVQVRNFLTFWMDDAQTYAVGGAHLLAGEPIYAPFQLTGPYGLGDAAWGRGFAYPPTAALIFAPLSPLGQTGLGIVFVAALAVLGGLAYKTGIRSGLAPVVATVVALVVVLSGPAINATSSGNVNLLIADALLASWLWPRSSGYLAVIGGLVKFFPAAGLVWTIRKRGSLPGPVVFGLVAVLLATEIAGASSWRDFLIAFGNGRSSSFFPLPSPAQILGPGIGTAVGYSLAALTLVGVWRIRDERVAFALLGWAMILPAPDWWSHYLLLPLAAVLPLATVRLAEVTAPHTARGDPEAAARLV